MSSDSLLPAKRALQGAEALRSWKKLSTKAQISYVKCCSFLQDL